MAVTGFACVWLTLATLCSPWALADSQAADQPISPTPTLTQIDRIETDLTLVTRDGSRLHLEGIAPPFRPLFLKSSAAWPWLEDARQILRQQTHNQTLLVSPVSLSDGTPAMDRYGRARVWLYPPGHPSDLQPAKSLQGLLLDRGLGRVFPLPDARQGLKELLRLETDARQKQKGAWRSWTYKILDQSDAQKGIGAFNLVQGRVKDVAKRPEATYLNFGEDWRDDFTVKITPEARKLFAEAGLTLSNLMGQEVLVRGWIFYRNGAMMELNQPEQIELLN